MKILELKNLSLVLDGKKILDKLNISFLKSGIYAIKIYNVMSTEVELIIKE